MHSLKLQTFFFYLSGHTFGDTIVKEGIDGYTDPIKYNDEVIFPDKVRLNRYYLNHYSFWSDIKMLFATVLGRRIDYAGERI